MMLKQSRPNFCAPWNSSIFKSSSSIVEWGSSIFEWTTGFAPETRRSGHDVMSTNIGVLNPWAIELRPNSSAGLRLWCFPYAGAMAQVYRPWLDSLPSTVEVCAIQLPGRGKRLTEPSFIRIQPLVESLARSLTGDGYLDKPFAFFGHSLGAMISYELAQYLRRTQGLGPEHLFVSGCRAPQVFNTGLSTYRLPDAEFVEAIRRLNGTPEEVLANEELMRYTMPLLRADFELFQTYRYIPKPPLDCPLTAYGGFQDGEAPAESVAAWAEHTSGAFNLRMMPGDHFFLHQEQDQLLADMTQELHQLTGRLKRR